MTNQIEPFNTMVIALFRANHAIIEMGDRISTAQNLSVARWKILGALQRAQPPLTVPQIAREMGLTRQAVQRTVDDLNRDGFIRAMPNPEHKRSILFELTQNGQTAFANINESWEKAAKQLIANMQDVDYLHIAQSLKSLSDLIEEEPI